MRVLRAPVVALGFLTRLPVSVDGIEARDLGAATAWFPLVGLFLGGVLLGIDRLAFGHVSIEVEAVALVAATTLLTGGLHLDGLADVFDGLGGGRGDRARTLAIMRDSRIGALGAAAMILGLLAKIAIVGDVLRGPVRWPLLLAPMAARAVAVLLVTFFPYARPEGLGRAFNGSAEPLAALVSVGLSAALAGLVGARSAFALASAVAGGLAIAFPMQRRLGGLTGDVYGAAIELAEIAFLLAATLSAG